MKPLPVTPYQQHKRDWLNCTRCLLHEHRQKVVLCRGKLPCDVLFVGEAPGESEDMIGSPFVGQAGILLDSIIAKALVTYRDDPPHLPPEDVTEPPALRIAFTNLIACIPHNEEGDKYAVPKEAIKACASRLEEFVRIVRPKAVVHVGGLAAKHFKPDDWEKRIGEDIDRPKFVRIDHPAFILRAGVADQGLLIQKCEVVLEDLFTELV